MITFVGSLDTSTENFHMMSPGSKTINSSEKRQSLSEYGITSPCTMNVVWDGDKIEVSF